MCFLSELAITFGLFTSNGIHYEKTFPDGSNYVHTSLLRGGVRARHWSPDGKLCWS